LSIFQFATIMLADASKRQSSGINTAHWQPAPRRGNGFNVRPQCNLSRKKRVIRTTMFGCLI
jgi:hypothetical protein